MSREHLLKVLESLGLSKADSDVYLCLAREPAKARSIVGTLELSKQQVYRSLRTLRAKGIVIATQARPAQFSAISLEKMLDLVVEVTAEQAKALQASKEELLSNWRSIKEEDSSNN